jgi:hypothetical protein
MQQQDQQRKHHEDQPSQSSRGPGSSPDPAPPSAPMQESQAAPRAPKRIVRNREVDERNMRSYRNRVRRRLFSAVLKREAAEEEAAVAALDADGASQPTTAESFGGALLDADMVGPGFAPAPDIDAFETGVALFNAGRYGEAVAAFGAAEEAAGGAKTRRGGQVALWRAQAVYAVGGAGPRAEAGRILTELETHVDADVGKAAAELRYILAAPELPMSADEYVRIPDFEDHEGLTAGPRWLLAQNGIGRVSRPKRDKPEKYSLEWYAEKARPETSDGDGTESVLLAAIVLALVLFLASAYFAQPGPGA